MNQRTRIGALALYAVCLLSACDDEKTDEAEQASPAEQVIALTTNIWGDQGATGYLFTIPSLESGAPSLDNAVELAGGAWLTGLKGHPHVYVSTGERGPVITRYDVDKAGRLTESTSISFEELGLTTGMRFGTAPMLSETKAYLVDAYQHRVATWNPAEMSIGRVIELDVDPVEGVEGWVSSVILQGKRLLVTVAWESDYRFPGNSRIYVIDTESDEVIASMAADCAQLAVRSQTPNGTVYYSPYAHSSAAQATLGEEYGSASCARRITRDGSTLDSKWQVDLSTLTGGKPAGELVWASDDVAFFRVFYAEESGITTTNWSDKQGTPSYRWWRWELNAEQAEELPGQDLTVEAAHYVVDGKTYLGNPSESWSETAVVQLDSERGLVPGVTLQGTPGGIVRVH